MAITIASFVGGRGGRDRGMLAGGTMMALFALLASSSSLWMPLWLVESDSNDGNVCYNGTGLFHRRWKYGSDIPGLEIECSNDGRSTRWTVCDVGAEDYDLTTCNRLTVARVLIICSSFSALLAMLLGVRGIESGINTPIVPATAISAAAKARG